MDALTHVFLPLAALILLKRNDYRFYFFASLSLLPDFDKVIGIPGLLHSIVTLALIILALTFIERRIGNEFLGISAFFILSHLFLDLLDGEPVTLLYPIVKEGYGIVFKAKIATGSFSFIGPIAEIVVEEPKKALVYDIFSGFGFASMIFFFLVLFRMRRS